MNNDCLTAVMQERLEELRAEVARLAFERDALLDLVLQLHPTEARTLTEQLVTREGIRDWLANLDPAHR